MATFPTVGGDYNSWGTELYDWLTDSIFASDGSFDLHDDQPVLKIRATDTALIDDGDVIADVDIYSAEGTLTPYTSDPAARIRVVTDGTKRDYALAFFTLDNTGGDSFTLGERLRIASTGRVGIGTSDPKTKLHAVSSTIVGCDASAVADGDLGNGQVNIWVDEAGNNLTFKVKYSTGTVKSGTVALA